MKTNSKYIIIEFNIDLTDYSQKDCGRKVDFLTFVYSSKEEAQSKFPEDLTKIILKKYPTNFDFQPSFAEESLKKEAADSIATLLSDSYNNTHFIYGVVDFCAQTSEEERKDNKNIVSGDLRGYDSDNDVLSHSLPTPCYITNFYLEDGDTHSTFVYLSEEERKKNLFKDFINVMEDSINESLDKDIEEGIDGFWAQAEKEITKFSETNESRFDALYHKESIFHKYDYNLSIIFENSAN